MSLQKIKPALIKKKIELKSIKSVMFVRLGKLGDMMIASWILKTARTQYPHLKIGLLTLPKSAELFKYNNDINVLKLWRPATAPLIAITERLRKWDLVVDLNDEPSRRSVLAKKIIAPALSIAFENDKSRGIFNEMVKTLDKEKSHVLERLSVMAAELGLGFSTAGLKPVVYLKPGSLDARKITQKKEAGDRSKIISLNISAGHRSRYLDADKWVAIGKALQTASKNIFIRVLASPADSAVASEIAKQIGGRVLPAVKSGLNDFLTAIAASDMIVSPDTSAVHAACAFDIPVLGLYPEPYWNFVSWRPLSAGSFAIRARGEGIDSIRQDEIIKVALKMARAIKKSRI